MFVYIGHCALIGSLLREITLRSKGMERNLRNVASLELPGENEPAELLDDILSKESLRYPHMSNSINTKRRQILIITALSPLLLITPSTSHAVSPLLARGLMMIFDFFAANAEREAIYEAVVTTLARPVIVATAERAVISSTALTFAERKNALQMIHAADLTMNIVDFVQLFSLVPKLQLGNPVREALASRLPSPQKAAAMPRSRYRVQCNPCPHFLTATVNHWLPLFTRPETVNIVLDSWRFLQRDLGFQLYGYVILENHLHLIAASEDLSHDMQRFKSYTAKQIIAHLEQCRSVKLLELLAFLKRAHKQDTTYQVWEEGNHPQIIESEAVMRQKLDYIHQNPVKRGYVDQPEHWRYSSARNYAGQAGLIEVIRAW